MMKNMRGEQLQGMMKMQRVTFQPTLHPHPFSMIHTPTQPYTHIASQIVHTLTISSEPMRLETMEITLRPNVDQTSFSLTHTHGDYLYEVLKTSNISPPLTHRRQLALGTRPHNSA